MFSYYAFIFNLFKCIIHALTIASIVGIVTIVPNCLYVIIKFFVKVHFIFIKNNFFIKKYSYINFF